MIFTLRIQPEITWGVQEGIYQIKEEMHSNEKGETLIIDTSYGNTAH